MPKRGDGTYIDDKKYLRISAGPLRGKRVHVLVAEAMLGRKLESWEDVHHKNLKHDDPSPENLLVMGKSKHAEVSNRQKWFLKQKFAKEDRAWLDWITTGGDRPDGEPEETALMFEHLAGNEETSFNPEEGQSNG